MYALGCVLYNALTGLAVGFEGYVLGNAALIIAGIVVGENQNGVVYRFGERGLLPEFVSKRQKREQEGMKKAKEMMKKQGPAAARKLDKAGK